VSFDSPYLLLSLLAVPAAIGIYLLAERRRMRYAIRFTNLEVLAGIVPRRAWRRYIPPVLFLLALTSLCLALARPHVKTSVLKDQATVILVIDVSGSMQAKDVKPTRLLAAQAAARAFLEHAPKGLRVGLIAFAGEPEVAAPPTTDHKLVIQSLDSLDMFPGFGGTAIGDALAAAVQLGQQAVQAPPKPPGQTIAYVIPTASQSGASPVSILFLSDGSQTRGTLQPLDGAARAKAASIPVYTFALGTPGGTLSRGFGPYARTIPVPPDPATLRAIAETTGGQFLAATSAEPLKAAYSRLGSKLGTKPGRTEVTYKFLGAAALLLLAAGLLSALWSPRLP
jgi:Ca-activated chloride channel family protein